MRSGNWKGNGFGIRVLGGRGGRTGRAMEIFCGLCPYIKLRRWEWDQEGLEWLLQYPGLGQGAGTNHWDRPSQPGASGLCAAESLTLLVPPCTLSCHPPRPVHSCLLPLYLEAWRGVKRLWFISSENVCLGRQEEVAYRWWQDTGMSWKEEQIRMQGTMGFGVRKMSSGNQGSICVRAGRLRICLHGNQMVWFQFMYMYQS